MSVGARIIFGRNRYSAAMKKSLIEGADDKYEACGDFGDIVLGDCTGNNLPKLSEWWDGEVGAMNEVFNRQVAEVAGLVAAARKETCETGDDGDVRRKWEEKMDGLPVPQDTDGVAESASEQLQEEMKKNGKKSRWGRFCEMVSNAFSRTGAWIDSDSD